MNRRAALPLLMLAVVAPVRAADPSYSDPELTAADRAHWAFVPPKRPPVPAGEAHPIDAFIRVKLAEKKLKPSPESDRATLIRRLTFDLHGLPPTPDEVEAFVKDTAADAYEKVVDRLLASPHFGERWAQHWLDLVRFAESNGFEIDSDRPHAWKYRDYVIRSFNDDKPYDRFLTEQLAGDLLAKDKTGKDAEELWVATGMHRCGPIQVVAGNVDPAENRQEQLTEMVNGVGSAVLGLTLACARCHDHKFDPISAGDYYRMQAFFAGARYRDVDFASKDERDAFNKAQAEVKAKLEPLKAKVAKLDAPYRAKVREAKLAKQPEAVRTAVSTPADKRTAEQKKLVKDAEPVLKVTWDEVLEVMSDADRASRAGRKREMEKVEEALLPPPSAAWAVAADKTDPPTHVLKRGDVRKKLSAIPPGFVRVAAAQAGEPKTRLDLAQWLTDPAHPLTARVTVNRLWQHHFGRGIVNTPNDFGTRGDKPTHPDLLDWLAVELVEPTISASGGRQPPVGEPKKQGADAPRSPGTAWSLKRLHKLMVMSKTYRQVSDTPVSAEARAADPENELLGRMNRRRLDAEAIRDALLTASGELNRAAYGRSVRVPLEKEVYDLLFTEDEPDGLWRVTPDARQHTRRSIYLFAKRNVRQPLLEAFDQPDTLGPCAARGTSTFAPQALILMNGPVGREAAAKLAELVASAKSPADRVTAIYARALGRPPRAAEATAAVAFLTSQAELLRKEKAADPDRAALVDLCLAVFNVSEFVYAK